MRENKRNEIKLGVKDREEKFWKRRKIEEKR